MLRALFASLATGMVLAHTYAQPLETQHPRALLIVFNPIIESHGGQRLNVVGNWNNPYGLTGGYIDDVEFASHGLVNYRLEQTIVADVFPLKQDGFRYTDETYMQCLSSWSGWHTPDLCDYKAKSRDYDWARKVDSGQLDEVLDHSAPFFGGYETRMLGRGGYWCNSPPQTRIACSKIFIVSVFNYERGVGEMLEDLGHRAESILSYVYSGAGEDSWYKFSLYDLASPGNAGCGNVHFAPNSYSDYDWGNPRYVWSTCDDWLNNFPNLTGEKIWVNTDEWGGGDMRAHHVWWFERMPHVAGSLTQFSATRLNNWWEYIQDFNTHPESNGDHAPGGSAPDAYPYPGSTRQLSSNIADDWAPRVNSAGKVAWFGKVGATFEIFTRNLDGTGFTRVTNNGASDESPEINAAGRLVWQMFDGQDYEIFSANADGTGLVQITSNTTDDWHAQINDQDRIVWDGWDGFDYEVFSANADGTNVVQITNNSATFPARPREDVWPQINNSNRVAWFGYDGNDWEIFSANADGTDLVNVSNNSREDEYPQINDVGRIVWMSYHDDTNCEIYSGNSNGTNVVRLTSNSYEDWWPQINNANPAQVAWMGRTGGDWEVFTCPATGGAALNVSNNSTHDQYPQIADDGRIAWQGFDGNDWEIYAYMSLADVPGVYQLTDNDYHDRWPSMDEADNVVWHAESQPDSTGGTSEIWAAGSGTADVTAPVLVAVLAPSATEVRVTFSEALDPASAAVAANYVITPEIEVLAAELHADQSTVVLTTSDLTPEGVYTLAVSDVFDLGIPPNPVAPGTQMEFTYHVYERVTDGLAVLYDFAEGAGATVYDVSDVGTPLDLTIANPANVLWTDGGLAFVAGTQAATMGAATKLIDACRATNEVTLEAWIIPALAEQGGPARIVTLSNGLSARNFTLGQGAANGAADDVFDVRLRTTSTSTNGLPSLTSPSGTTTATLTHVAYARGADGTVVLYKNAAEVAETVIAGDFSNWNSAYRLGIGDEFFGGKAWLGEFRLAAVYSRALSADEIVQNYLAGPDPVVVAVLAGDVNCDGAVGFADINPFVLALSNPAVYEATYPDCPVGNRDINGDGQFGFEDINPFVALLAGGGAL
jgi:Tol biopolymer transport system component